MKARPSFPYFYLKMAQVASERGDCRRRQVGAVVVTPRHIAIPGYNGTKGHGIPGCLDGACPRGLKSLDEVPAYAPYTDCIARHAEDNAIMKAHEAGLDLRDSAAYVTSEPCGGCYELLANAGVKDVWWCVEEMFSPGGSPGYRSLY